ncbi:hypothetical protein PHK61_30875 [Actinomycetospora lutea]|uniref:Hsp70 family protein n=1 Tax=Actinomycetospora lutea TaxID=663604 RepID=UPI0023651E5A|nr:hypothetical protein [Actinomycetospora lutea]MDD7942827.1 hypothetical protein [Actinomycetospora lutea]
MALPFLDIISGLTDVSGQLVEIYKLKRDGSFFDQQKYLAELKTQEEARAAERDVKKEVLLAHLGEERARADDLRAEKRELTSARLSMASAIKLDEHERELASAPYNTSSASLYDRVYSATEGGRKPALLLAPFFSDTDGPNESDSGPPAFRVAIRRAWMASSSSNDMAMLDGVISRPLRNTDLDILHLKEALGALPVVLVYGEIQQGKRVWSSVVSWNLVRGRPGDALSINFPALPLPEKSNELGTQERLDFEDALGGAVLTTVRLLANWFHAANYRRSPADLDLSGIPPQFAVGLAGAYEIAYELGIVDLLEARVDQCAVLERAGARESARSAAQEILGLVRSGGTADPLPIETLRTLRELLVSDDSAHQEAKNLVETASRRMVLDFLQPKKVMTRVRVVAAIDFGTHGSGFAWSVITDQNRKASSRQIKVRTQWDGQYVASAKNLSAVLFSEDSDERLEAWGFEARRLVQLHPDFRKRYTQNFKMQLASTSPEVGQEGYSNKPTETITLYLAELRKAALQDITSAGFADDQIRWCLTVPAIWDEAQKETMRTSAVDAGFPEDRRRLILALEPEAAAHHAKIAGLRTAGATGGRRASLEAIGSRFMIADCGGGTVDLTAYRSDRNSKLVEIGRDFGGPFGSEYLNVAFVDLVLSRRFGSHEFLANVIAEKPSAFAELVAGWERAKLSIDLGEDRNVFISIPAAIDRMMADDVRARLAEQQDGIDDHIVLKRAEVELVFETVVPSVLDLVDKQLDEMKRGSPNARNPIIILVGGFGASPYLQARLIEHVSGRAEVLVPPDPAVSVLYGATHFAYDPQTAARRSKFTYGCDAAHTFRQGIDLESRSFVGPDGVKRCNRFSRYVSAGQVVPVDEVVSHEYMPIWENQKTAPLDIYRTTLTDPIYVTKRTCEKIGSLTVDLTPVLQLPINRRGGELSMYFGETEIRAVAIVKETGEAIRTTLSFDSKTGV